MREWHMRAKDLQLPQKRNIWLFYIRLLLRPFAIHIISQLQTLQQSTKFTKSKTTKFKLVIIGIKRKQVVKAGRVRMCKLAANYLHIKHYTTKHITSTLGHVINYRQSSWPSKHWGKEESGKLIESLKCIMQVISRDEILF